MSGKQQPRQPRDQAGEHQHEKHHQHHREQKGKQSSHQLANRLDVPKVRILGGGEIHNHPANDNYALSAGWETFQDRMYDQAGCGPSDMRFAQLYDDYPVMEFIQLDGLGLAERGGAARLIRDNDCTVKGSLPINTGGGQLSAGQCGASGRMIGVYEAVVQLRGEAGARQVASCDRGVVTGYGTVSYGRGVSAWFAGEHRGSRASSSSPGAGSGSTSLKQLARATYPSASRT